MYPWLKSLLYKDFLKSLRIFCVLSETAQNQPVGQKLMSSLHYNFPLGNIDCTDDTEAKSPGTPRTGSLVDQVLNTLVAGCREACTATVNALSLDFWGFVWYPTSQACLWSMDFSLHELKASRQLREGEGKGKSKSIYSLKSDISWRNSPGKLQLQAIWFPLQPLLQLCAIPSSYLQIKSAMCAALPGLGGKTVNCRKFPSDSDSWGLEWDPSNPSVIMAFQKWLFTAPDRYQRSPKVPFFGDTTISPMLHGRPLANLLC